MFNSQNCPGFCTYKEKMYDVAYALEAGKESRSGSSQFFRDWCGGVDIAAERRRAPYR